MGEQIVLMVKQTMLLLKQSCLIPEQTALCAKQSSLIDKQMLLTDKQIVLMATIETHCQTIEAHCQANGFNIKSLKINHLTKIHIMTQTQENYLTMARTSVKVLDNYSELWSTHPKFSSIKAKVAAILVRMGITQQGGGAVSTGVTIDKEMAGDNAIEIAVRLAGLGQVYASEENNFQLYDQLKVTYTSLDRLQDNVLGAALTLIYKTLNNLGDAVIEYGVTTEELTGFNNAIETFENINNNPRVVISGRKGHNENVPVLIRELRQEFNNIDRMIKIWEHSNPKFISDYQNARIIINLGTRHRPVEPGDTENK